MKRKETYYVDEEKIAAFKNFSFFSLFFVSFFFFENVVLRIK